MTSREADAAITAFFARHVPEFLDAGERMILDSGGDDTDTDTALEDLRLAIDMIRVAAADAIGPYLIAGRLH